MKGNAINRKLAAFGAAFAVSAMALAGCASGGRKRRKAVRRCFGRRY